MGGEEWAAGLLSVYMDRLVAKWLVYFSAQLMFGQNARGDLSQAMDAERKSSIEINRLRDEKVASLVRYAYGKNLFYKARMDAAGVRPDLVRGVKDLERLPVLSKREILENEKVMVSSASEERLFVRKTGGSTGMTLHFMKGAEALARNDAIMYRCYAWYGINIGDKQVRFWGVPVTNQLRWKEQIKDLILNRIRISAFDISEAACLKQYERIRKFKPDYFYGYTTAIYGFCLFMKKLGINLKSLPLKAVICTAEKMYDHHLSLFRESFSCPVVDEYGSSENGIIAFQCRSNKMHVMADHLVVEFLGDDGRPVKSGELGNIVVTDLSSHAMPLIRYEIGDMGRPSAEMCSCGVSLPLMEIVEGRKEDFIRTEEGSLIHAAYLCYTLKDDTVSEFKMYQKDMKKLLVYLVKSSSFTDGTEKILDAKLRSALGNDFEITFEYVDRIPRESSGKLRYFVSELPVVVS